MNEAYFIIGLVVLFLIVAAMIGFRDRKRAAALFLSSLRKEYGAVPKRKYDKYAFDRIPRYYEEHHKESHLDDITWNDLDMDRVFKRINYCHSAAGEEYLYFRLRSPRQEDDFKDFESRVSLFEKENVLREKVQILMHRIGYTSRYSIYDYLGTLDQVGKRSNVKEYLAIAAILVSVLLMFVRFPIGLTLFFILLAYQMLTYYREKAKIEPYFVSFAYVLRMLQQGKAAADSLAESLPEESQDLKEILKTMASFRRGGKYLNGKMSGADGSPLGIILDYVYMLLHLDLIQFNRMFGQIKEHGEDVDHLITIMGLLDAETAIACYRASLSEQNGGMGYCLPVFTSEPVYHGEAMYHPLLEEPVPDSIRADRCVLLTGSNASGKSTFLRTCALNAVFAQTIHTCTAQSYEAPFYRICSSMALRDNLTGGDSYYMVEIKSLKRILDLAGKEGSRVLCFIDEVLRGTNTVERIAASAQILHYFSGCNVQCLAATHDIELTALLGDHFDNYHFEGTIENGDVQFTYKLIKGPATSRNAIQLLKLIGYQPEIVERASDMAANFVETGDWDKAFLEGKG